jgi:hypothetical protein
MQNTWSRIRNIKKLILHTHTHTHTHTQTHTHTDPGKSGSFDTARSKAPKGWS